MSDLGRPRKGALAALSVVLQRISERKAYWDNHRDHPVGEFVVANLDSVLTWLDDVVWELGVDDTSENGVGGGAHET